MPVSPQPAGEPLSFIGLRPGHWIDESVLAPLVELNEQALQLACRLAADPQDPLGAGSQLPPAVRELRDHWVRLDASGCARLARCPYGLIDAGFGESGRWCASLTPAVSEPPRPPMFAGDDGRSLSRLVLGFGWHLARSNPRAAELVLGMTPACIEVLRVSGLAGVERLANARPDWVQLRWSNRVPLWRQLLVAAVADDAAALERAHLAGLAVLAGEVLNAREAP